MELILRQLEESEYNHEDGSDDEDVDDEVSFIYYGDNCSCSKNSMCKSSKCLCFLRGEKCTDMCHKETKNKCVNK